MKLALALIALVACSHPPAPREPSGPVEDYLVTSAASDFHAHQKPEPTRFRDVHVGRVLGGYTRLCGQFLSGDTWTPFATIKMESYEQWIGTTNHCTDATIVWEPGDLSAALQRKLATLH